MPKLEQVWLVTAIWNYEGSSPVRAFIRESSASAFVDTLRRYHETKPALDANAEGEEWLAETDKYDAWKQAHPAGEHGDCDGFDYCAVPFGDPK